MAMRTGNRKFGGKRYDFYMFANTKTEAQESVRRFVKREREQFKHKGLARITQGKDPRRPYGKRYLIWVRVERL